MVNYVSFDGFWVFCFDMLGVFVIVYLLGFILVLYFIFYFGGYRFVLLDSVGCYSRGYVGGVCDVFGSYVCGDCMGIMVY